jgi:hypothetical protein
MDKNRESIRTEKITEVYNSRTAVQTSIGREPGRKEEKKIRKLRNWGGKRSRNKYLG